MHVDENVQWDWFKTPDAKNLKTGFELSFQWIISFSHNNPQNWFQIQNIWSVSEQWIKKAKNNK